MKTNSIKQLLDLVEVSDEPKSSLAQILREFGIMGYIAYIGGLILLTFFPFQGELSKQILFSLSGLFLLTLATLITYHRISAQRAREKSLIEMTQNANNRLAEQLGKGLTEKQVEFIGQKIRQNQRDLFATISNQKLDK